MRHKDHTAEMATVRDRHDARIAAEQCSHHDEIHNLENALDSRDIFVQAKGIMVTMRCDADTPCLSYCCSRNDSHRWSVVQHRPGPSGALYLPH